MTIFLPLRRNSFPLFSCLSGKAALKIWALSLFLCCNLITIFYKPAAAQTNAPHIITLNETAVLETDIVTLGDVFTGLPDKLAETAVSRAPAFGKIVTWNYRVLGRLAKRYRLKWQPQSRLDQIKLSRLSVNITRADIEIVLKQELETHYPPESDLDIQLDSRVITIPIPPDADPTPLIEDMRIDQQNNRFYALIALLPESPKPIRKKITGRIYEMRNVPVLQNVVPSQTPITEQDLKWIRVKARQLRQNIITQTSQIVGKTPKRNLQVGKLIRTSDIEDIRYVKRGDLVTVTLQAPSMTLTVQGKAMDDGTLGETIRIKNLQSNKIVNGKIIASGKVIVRAPFARPLN